MDCHVGNLFRASVAASDRRVLNNLPGRYAVEDWRAFYWAMNTQGKLDEHQVTIQLPEGYAERWPVAERGKRGCIYRVARWGLACYVSTLEDMGFDVASFFPSDQAMASEGDILQAMIAVTHFDLPGHFVIASPTHSLLLFGPDGRLRGSCVHWYTYLGALAWLRSGGRIKAPFIGLCQENPGLYAEALGYLL
jgi:hypothetical protein